MSLRKTYEQALQNQSRTLDARDEKIVDLVRQTAEAITRDGDFTARVTDITPNGKFVLDVRGTLARAGRAVELDAGEVWQAYDSASGHEATAVTDLVESVVQKLASQQAEANRVSARKTLLGLR